MKKKKESLEKPTSKNEFVDEIITLTIPLRTKSEANSFDHWRVKHERHRKQRFLVFNALKPYAQMLRMPCSILFTRYAPKKLDKHDNLPISFKYIVDACCTMITKNYVAGRADDDERISIAYDQVISKEYSIKIEITF